MTTRCPQCDTPLCLMLAARPIDPSTPPKSSEPEKVPTPASDSAKGERDIFGREIIERLGGAFIVKAGGGFMVSRPDGLWWDGGQWHDETNPHNPWATNIAESQTLLPSAAKSLELPTANPAASAKVGAISEGEKQIVEMVNEWDEIPVTSSTHDDFLFDAIVELKREVAELRKARQ